MCIFTAGALKGSRGRSNDSPVSDLEVCVYVHVGVCVLCVYVVSVWCMSVCCECVWWWWYYRWWWLASYGCGETFPHSEFIRTTYPATGLPSFLFFSNAPGNGQAEEGVARVGVEGGQRESRSPRLNLSFVDSCGQPGWS